MDTHLLITRTCGVYFSISRHFIIRIGRVLDSQLDNNSNNSNNNCDFRYKSKLNRISRVEYK